MTPEKREALVRELSELHTTAARGLWTPELADRIDAVRAEIEAADLDTATTPPPAPEGPPGGDFAVS